MIETPAGFQTGIEAPDFRSVFFEKGTYAKKGAARALERESRLRGAAASNRSGS